ncbi:PREDICTED: uncharacterized protein LOC104613333 [Nelumbo nucifera]|uniref:Glycosyltransferase 61 catalytic domain-containing protein n=2 Tax=Nelumbo nucifera TaxID=4432 RepID=A0A822YII7_NELNU|nr:PREDICTED: uncharacterized protein LOC104613333 [Nelumbo nucifera]DAD31933.1 TPA_asm: hypothetical protein HUJ06_010784 [Nelumbo nucifera]
MSKEKAYADKVALHQSTGVAEIENVAYNAIFAKSFSRNEQKKLGCGALAVFLMIVLSLCTVLKPYLGPLPILKLRVPVDSGVYMLTVEDTMSSSFEQKKEDLSRYQPIVAEKEVIKETKIMCNVSERRSDFCEVDGDVRIQANSSTIFAVSSSQTGIPEPAGNDSWAIRPYARKGDKAAMGSVNQLWVKSFAGHEEAAPQCTLNHSVPAIVFSTGGYTGNNFHEFTDTLIPLFITSRQFNGEVQFVVTDYKAFWVNKYQVILKHLSRYEIINMDKDHQIHCFPRVVVGLKCHKELSIDPSKSPNGYSMLDFTEFLRSSYSLKRGTVTRIGDRGHKKPRLLIISRKRTRSFMNVGEIAKMARRLGYKVAVAEATSNLSQFAQDVNSCDVLMGVHGAGLTNMIFLPANAILIQIVPFGLDWLATYDFGKPALDMNIRYLEYKIKEEESSLIQQYPSDHAVFRDPPSVHKYDWQAFRALYLDNQNVKLDVRRFKATLLKAIELFHQ